MWSIGGKQLKSRLMIGSALYPSPEIMTEAIQSSKSDIVTVSIRRQSPHDKAGKKFWELIQSLSINILPNTAGCKTVKEAIAIAHMARELFKTNWIKLEVIGDDYTLQPNTFLLVEASRELNRQGFEVFPYTTEDLVVADYLVEAGCKTLMPWGSPIGSGKGLLNTFLLKTLRSRFPSVNLILDAGIGTPSHATQALELGFNGVLINTAIAKAHDPIKMAHAFYHAVEAGRAGYEAGLMASRDLAKPSTPTLGTPFWHQEK